MSLRYKLILPLLHNELDLKDISKNSGFEEMYSRDINRKVLNNHFFLLYKNDSTKESTERINKFKTLNSIIGEYSVVKNNTKYTLYAFAITNKSINYLMLNTLGINNEDRLRIYKFWKLTDDEINNHMLNENILLSEKFIPNVLT